VLVYCLSFKKPKDLIKKLKKSTDHSVLKTPNLPERVYCRLSSIHVINLLGTRMNTKSNCGSYCQSDSENCVSLMPHWIKLPIGYAVIILPQARIKETANLHQVRELR
jgi:hypothetical protein